jgi:hypothetical protein
MQTFNVLYTKQLHKKVKSWSDGRVVLKPTGLALLRSDEGKELSSARPSKHIDFAEEEGITCFEGFIVNGDGVCDNPEENFATVAASSDSKDPCPQPCSAPVLALPLVTKRRSFPAVNRKPNISTEQCLAQVASTHTTSCPDPLSGI